MGLQNQKIDDVATQSTATLPTEENTENSNDMAGVLAIITGAASAISGIWTSTNTLKTKRIENENIQEELKVTTENNRSKILTELAATKQKEIEKATLQERYNANIRAVVYSLLAALVGYGAFLYAKSKKYI